jgi:Fic family protein
LSLETLARVHELTAGRGTGRVKAGQLRQGAAVIRWSGVITYRAPPVAAARSQVSDYLGDLAAELQQGNAARHPATMAAEAVATLTSSHLFADGNGRTARALATWLLLRSGFRRRAEGTLGTFLDAHLDEHYRALRNCQASPWGWHQLFYDAVLVTFEPRRSCAAQ